MIFEIPNVVIGILIIVINALPLILRKPKYLILTAAISLMLIFGLKLFG